MALSFRSTCFFWFIVSLGTTNAKLPQSPPLESAGSEHIYGGLNYGDSREDVLSKLRKQGFIQIYEELIKESLDVQFAGMDFVMNW